MIKINFTEEEKQALDYARYNYPDPRVQRKMGALWLKSLGLSHEEICRVTGISPNTLRSYLRAYQRGGIEALKRLKFYQPQSEMSQHRTTIEEYFREHPPASVKEAMAKIEELTWIKRSENFLLMLRISCWLLFLAYCGVSHDYSSKPPRAESDSTFWVR